MSSKETKETIAATQINNSQKKWKPQISALTKTTFREIRRSFGRFISILCLIALGVLAYVGISVTGADMRYTGIKYANDYKLADIFVQSTYGLDESDMDKLAEFHDLKLVEYGYATDVTAVKADIKDDHKVEDKVTLKVESLPQTLSQYEVVSGRLPEQPDEIILDNAVAKKYQLGDKITLISTAEIDKSLDNLNRDTFTVVGFANSPEYFSIRTREMSLSGKGEINGFAGVLPSVFKLDVYTIARAQSTLLNRSETDTEMYDKQIKTQIKKLSDDLNESAETNTRVQKLRTDLQEQLDTGEQELAQAKRIFGANSERVIKGENDLALLRNQLDKLELPRYIVTGQNDLIAHHSFFDNGERLDVLAYIFPVFLFFIAVLVTSTTMKRMVEEQRPQIGALKSLGYRPLSIMKKYLVYGIIPGTLGTILGAVLGLTVLPILIYSSYQTSYIFPRLLLRFSAVYVFIGVVIALLCTVIPVIFAVNSSVAEKTISLMRPKAQKAGKRIFLEHIPFIWNHLSFTAKVTARNIFRYKERMGMTVLGIAGSIALIIMGFGIRDALTATLDLQLNKIYHYDIMSQFNSAAPASEMEAYNDVINKNKAISGATKVIFDAVEVPQTDGENKAVTIIVPEKPEDLNEYIDLFDLDSQPIALQDTSVSVSQELAEFLGTKVGDQMVFWQDDKEYHATVGAINQWYFRNQVVFSPKYYETIFGKEPVYNAYLLKVPDEQDVPQVLLDLQNTEANLAASTLTSMTDLAKGTLDGLTLVTGVLLSLSILLAVIVLYNLTNINISERIRELSTIKVLGFYPSEVTRYIYRETLLLTIMGIVVGWFLGTALEQFVVIKIPPEQFMFYRKVFWTNYALSSVLILAVALIIMVVMHIKLKRVDMLDALKAVE